MADYLCECEPTVISEAWRLRTREFGLRGCCCGQRSFESFGGEVSGVSGGCCGLEAVWKHKTRRWGRVRCGCMIGESTVVTLAQVSVSATLVVTQCPQQHYTWMTFSPGRCVEDDTRLGISPDGHTVNDWGHLLRFCRQEFGVTKWHHQMVTLDEKWYLLQIFWAVTWGFYPRLRIPMSSATSQPVCIWSWLILVHTHKTGYININLIVY